jgi:arabinofuranan 3-O-arabinosyltransferase
MRWRLAGRAVATNGPSLDELFAPLSQRFVRLSATSTFAGDPAVAAANAFDRRADTSWYASPLDSAPALQLSWRGQRTIREVLAILEPGAPGGLPAAFLVDPMTGDGDLQLVTTRGPDAGAMKPVHTNRLRISVPPNAGPAEGVGVSELRIKGLEDLRYGVRSDSSTGLVCGFGPTVEIGGETVQTRVTGTIADVVGGGELGLEPCGSGPIEVPPGVQRIRVTNPSGFAVSRLWLTPAGGSAAATTSGPRTEVFRWDASDRTVAVQTADDAVLVVPQSYNRGWRATIGSTRLTPVLVDGWKQGWQVPGGTSGAVRLVFEPQGVFAASIVAGLVLALLLMLGAIATLTIPRLTARGTPGPVPATGPDGLAVRPSTGVRAEPRSDVVRRTALGIAVLLLAIVSLPLAAGAVAGYLLKRSTSSWSAAAVGLALAAAVLATITGDGTAVRPSGTSDVIVALLVGSICGAVLGRHDEGGSEPL